MQESGTCGRCHGDLKVNGWCGVTDEHDEVRHYSDGDSIAVFRTPVCIRCLHPVDEAREAEVSARTYGQRTYGDADAYVRGDITGYAWSE